MSVRTLAVRLTSLAATTTVLVATFGATGASAADTRLSAAQLKQLVAKVDFAPTGWFTSAARAHGLNSTGTTHWCGTLQPAAARGSTWASHKGSSLTIEVDQQAAHAEAQAAYDAIAKLKFSCPHVMVSNARGLPSNILDVGLTAGDGSLVEELVTVQGSALLWAGTHYRGAWTPAVTRDNHHALHALAAAYKRAAAG